MFTIYGADFSLLCDCGAPANFMWQAWNKTYYACQQHNPLFNPAIQMPMNFTGHTICPTCGK